MAEAAPFAHGMFCDGHLIEHGFSSLAEAALNSVLTKGSTSVDHLHIPLSYAEIRTRIMTMINAYGQPVGDALPDWKAPAFPEHTPMYGRFCRLEPLNPSDHGESLFVANSLDPDARAWTYLPYGPFTEYSAYQSWLNQQATSKDPLFFAIIDLHTQKAVGLAAYLRIDVDVGVIEVGHLKYSNLMQRTPISTEAMFLMAQSAFHQGYRRYEWKCDALNQPSRSAAERLGFTFEGIFRQARVVKGRNRDTAWYSILECEWPTLAQCIAQWLARENFDEQQRQRMSLQEIRKAVLSPSSTRI